MPEILMTTKLQDGRCLCHSEGKEHEDEREEQKADERGAQARPRSKSAKRSRIQILGV